jgi:cation:H+ antiporter
MRELFKSLGLWGNIAVFVAAAALILVAGSKLERWAERIGRVTKLGDVFAGMILLAVATSLPEIATSATAALHGNVGLAVNNLLGGVILQTMVLAMADVVGKRQALTGQAPSFGLLLQGVGLVLVLATAAVVASLESHWRDLTWVSDAGAGAIVCVYVVAQYVTMRSQRNPRWSPTRANDEHEATDRATDRSDQQSENESLSSLVVLFAIGSALVCAGGYAIVQATESIAASTGASQSFLGFTLVALATSLPEVSTTLAANRRGHGVTAASNIFGSNSFDVSLLLLVALMTQKPLFADALIPSLFAASLGIILTAVYLIGLLERQDRTILRMGWDSAAVMLLGFGGIWIMYVLGAK